MTENLHHTEDKQEHPALRIIRKLDEAIKRLQDAHEGLVLASLEQIEAFTEASSYLETGDLAGLSPDDVYNFRRILVIGGRMEEGIRESGILENGVPLEIPVKKSLRPRNIE